MTVDFYSAHSSIPVQVMLTAQIKQNCLNGTCPWAQPHHKSPHTKHTKSKEWMPHGNKIKPMPNFHNNNKTKQTKRKSLQSNGFSSNQWINKQLIIAGSKLSSKPASFPTNSSGSCTMWCCVHWWNSRWLESNSRIQMNAVCVIWLLLTSLIMNELAP